LHIEEKYKREEIMKSSAPLTKSQYGLYVECMAHQGELCHNIAFLYELDPSLDEARLKSAIEAVVAAHPTLFTRIGLNGQGEPVQSVDDSETFTLEVEHTADIEREKREMVVPYDIFNDRLFRIRLLRDSQHYYLFIDTHHIISDGSTLRLLLSDIATAYGGGMLEPEAVTMMDVAKNEAERRQTPAFEEARQWYARNFDCGDTFSQLIPDKEEAESRVGILSKEMGVSLEAVDAYCKEHGIFKSTFFTAVYAYLMAKYTGEGEALFGTVYSGRTDRRLARSACMLVNTVPVYAKFDDDTTVLDLLKAVQEQMRGCREHSIYSYTDVIGDLKLQMGSFFAWHGTIFDDIEIGGKPTTATDLFHATSEVPLYVKAMIRDGKYCLTVEYRTNLYSEQLAGHFLESYEAVVEGFLREKDLRNVSIATKAQLEELDGFNNTDVPYDEMQTVCSLFRKQVEMHPDNVAVVYRDKRYTYREVDDISERIAAYIQGKGLGKEDVVSVLIPRSEWMVIASLGVLKAGAAYQPLDPSYPEERLNFMMQDANVKMLITDDELRPLAGEYQGEVLLTRDISTLPAADAPVQAVITPSSLFIMLYTSGTTGQPKGCQLTHGNVVAFCHMHCRTMNIDKDSRVTAYASYGFDASLMDMWAPLSAGATVYIIPEEIRLDLLALNGYFEENGMTHAFMTTQVARQFVNEIENHSLRVLATGGESLSDVRPPRYTLLNFYGPTESTVYVTAYEVKDERKIIPIGKAVDNARLYIVDRNMHRQPVGATGELLVSGPQVARGYLNRPEKTAEAFVQTEWGRCYRTGDVVRYLPDGNLQFVGRKDGQVKIRGFRIELKEVESVIRDFHGIKDVTVQAFDDAGGGKFIAAYVVGDQEIDIEALNRFILEEKPPYMVPAVTMQIDKIPLNQNQKVDKRKLPEPVRGTSGGGRSGGADAEQPLNILEEDLKKMVGEIVHADDFSITDLLGYVGLTSISAIKLATQVYKRYGVTLDVKSLAKTATIQSIENEVLKKLMKDPLNPHVQGETQVSVGSSARGEGASSTSSSKQKDGVSLASPPAQGDLEGPFPLSYAQTGVYVECVKKPNSTVYNIPMCIRMPQGIDVQHLSKSIETIIKSHPQFFVHFVSEGSDIVQIVDTNQPVNVKQCTLSAAELERFKKEFVKPFNLNKGPLYRMNIVSCGQNVFLFADVHHLIADGGSLDLFLTQLCDLMNGEEIEAEIIRYADFVADEKAAEGSASYLEAKAFFQERLGSVEGSIEVPSDLTNPVDNGLPSDIFCPLDFSAIETFCKQHNISPAHLTLSAVFYTLARFTNNEQVCIATISNGRSDLRIRNTVGMFVNTLAMSAKIGEQTVMDFLTETGTNFDKTLTYEKYPYAQVAADYSLSTEILFAYEIGVLDKYHINGQKLNIEFLDMNAVKFHIVLYIAERDGVPGVVIEYENGRYSQEMMQNLGQSISNVVDAFIRQPEAMLKDVSLLDKNQEALLDSFNDNDFGYDTTETVVSLFRRQVEQHPDNLAVVFQDKRYTYREVDELSDRLAAYIASKGIGREQVVSILIPRCEWMVIASLGVLKAGAAYQPLDPSYPEERLNFMMQDAGAKMLIADEELRPLVEEYQGEVLLTRDIDTLGKPSNLKSQTSHLNLPLPSDLFILLYTSGSTGLPKGCQLEHGNLVNFCHWYQRETEMNSTSRVAAYASYGFDACMMDIYPAITCGACVYIIEQDMRLNLPALNEYYNTNGITHSFITTQVGYQFATSVDNHSLRYFAVGGEKLSALQPPENYTMLNGYGPTECTIFTTTYRLKEYEQDIPIGKPTSNTKLYIVDKQLNRLPPGAAGELLIAGPQVGRGYLNMPEKTASTFVEIKGWGRCYRTGDVVRYLPDGNLQFVGRKDGQVKIRGFRIELKEVESIIREYPGIRDVTVCPFDYPNGGKYIAAYVVSDTEVDVKALNDFIGQHKPSYMIPAATMQIDQIPLNQNQKVNRKLLPKPVIQAAEHEYVAPANGVEQMLCNIFAEVLALDKVGATDDFFEMGGTSLMVTRVIIEADKKGYHIAYGDIFSNPTARELAKNINANDNQKQNANQEDGAKGEIEGYDYEDINNLLKANTLEAFLNGESRRVGRALVTGATGYLGIHVLKTLIEREDVPEIWCMVRAENKDKAERRLKGLLFYYFGKNFKELFGSRLHVVVGDVTAPISLPLQGGAGRGLDTVFNCAAVVKHYSSGTEIEDVNIGGAENCINFCKQTGARLIHVSTYSTAGLSVDGVPGDDCMLTERKLYYGQFIENRYVHSKFISERKVLEAIASGTLDGKIMRVGNLAPRSADGEFQINFQTNSAMGRVRLYKMLGCYPYEQTETPVEFSPIDEVADAIVRLAETPRECCLFHPFNNHSVFLGDVLAELKTLGDAPRQVENTDFALAIEQAKEDPSKDGVLQSMVAYQDMAHGRQTRQIETSNAYTSQILYRLGFRWSPTSWDYVRQFLKAIDGLGYFD